MSRCGVQAYGSMMTIACRTVLAVIVFASLAAGFSSTALAATEQRRFEAFAEDGTPTVPVRKTEEADSCSASFVNSQSTALRCFAGNFIRDPCFIDPADFDRAVCTPSPSARSSIEMLGIEDADDGTRNTPSSRRPWALDLRGGSSCFFVSGASNSRQGKRLNYYCVDRRYLWGTPNRSTETWTILRSRTFTGRKWRRVSITVAWR